jgi:hypothetical protein
MTGPAVSQALLDERALAFAYEADHTFDERHEARNGIDTLMDRRAARTRLFQIMRRGRLRRLEERLHVAETAFRYCVDRASTLMPPLETNEATNAEDTIADRNVWNAMKPEQQDRAKALRRAMTGRFGQYGVREDSLRIVRTEGEGGPEFVIVHTGAGIVLDGEGLDTGTSYSAVEAPAYNDLFMLTVGDDTYDAREGMTYPTYVAMVDDIKAHGGILPDSQRAAHEATQEQPTYTLLIGEPLTNEGDALVVDTARFDETVILESVNPGASNPYVRVRPAVVIK